MAGGSVAGSASQAGLERLGDLLRNRQGFVQWDRSVRDALGERRTINQLHDERRRTGGSLKTVDGRNIWMVQDGEDFSLPLKASEALGI